MSNYSASKYTNGLVKELPGLPLGTGPNRSFNSVHRTALNNEDAKAKNWVFIVHFFQVNKNFFSKTILIMHWKNKCI